MTIEIKEKGSRQFYKEIVNIASQYGQLIYKPYRQISNTFTRYILLTVAMLLFFLLNLYAGIKGSFNTSRILMILIAAVAAVTTFIYLRRMNKMVDDYLADDRPALLTIDDNGVEIEKKGSQAVRLAWDNVAFVRSFVETTCFFAKDMSGIILSVTNKYEDEIFDYIKSNNIDVLVVR